MEYMIYIHGYPEILENVLQHIPSDSKIRELDGRDVLCIVGDRDIRDEIVDRIKQSLETGQQSRILPVKCMIESASLIELVFHDEHRMSFAKSTHY